jgi:Spy/CpxP family protein refolding chaperone
MVQHRIEMLTTLLSLIADQQQQATTIFTNAATSESTLRDSLKTAHQSLNDAVKKNDVPGIDQVSNTVGNLTAQLTSIEAKAHAAFYLILTPDQQAKLSQLQSQRRGPFGRGAGPGGFAGARGFRGGRQ